jgi:drug/metabolite transporter (DMT)-like permease
MDDGRFWRFSGILFLHFLLSTCFMFYKKEFVKLIPFPFFISFAQASVSVPVALIIAWISHRFAFRCSLCFPPLSLIPWLVASSIVQATSTIFLNIGFFASDLDFVILMRLTGLFWNGVMGIVFLGEHISRTGLFAVAVIVGGILLAVGDFQWSTTKMASHHQIGIQSVSIFLMSIGSLITKKIMRIIEDPQTHFSVFDYLAWASLITFPPILGVSILKEPEPWTQFETLLTSTLVWWTLIGAGIHQLLNLVIAHMHQLTTLMSIGVASQVRLLGSLMASYIVYRQTEWGISRTFGVILLAAGGVLYTYTRMSGSESPVFDEMTPEAPLISPGSMFSRASDSG